MSDYIPTTEEVRSAALSDDWGSGLWAAEFDRWLAKVKREVWDEAVNALIPTIRCDSEDITWVNKNPYWKVTDAGNSD